MKVLSVGLVAAASAALVLVGVGPASAVGNSIDPGDNLYSLNCAVTDAYPAFQLLHTDPTTAVSTTIGSGALVDEGQFACAWQPAYDPTTGKSYFIEYADQSGGEAGLLKTDPEPTDKVQTDSIVFDGPTYALASIDVATGVSTYINQFSYDDGEDIVPVNVTSIAIGIDGTALAFSDDGSSSTLWTLDLTTGALQPIDDGYPSDIYAFAVDPTTGIFWFVSVEDDQLYELDPANYGAAYETDFDLGDYSGIYSLQIDEGGTFWIEVDRNVGDGPLVAGLFSFTLAVEAPVVPVFSGDFTDGPFYTEALLLIPGDAPPQLASTGTDLNPMLLTAGGALLFGTLLLAGALVTRRRA